MLKKIVIPNNLNMIDELKDIVDGFILGIKDLSVNLPYYFTLDEAVKIITKYNNKEIFVSLNKNIHNSDLSYLKEILIKLNDLSIKGVIYYDASIVNLKKELKLNYDLIWGQEHMTTNYFTINYWLSHGVNYTYISSDITLDEIIEISNNTESKLMVPVFGYQPMFTSYRHLVKNYLNTFNLESTNNKYLIEKENNSYPIVDEHVTTIYSNNILNGIEELSLLKNIDYIVLNSYNIESNKFNKVISLFNDVNDDNKSEYYELIKDMFGNVDKGFLYKETVYKVKNNE